MQDEIVARLAGALDSQLVAAEARRAERAPTPDSMDLYFQGLAWLNKGRTPDHVAQARSFFDRALTADPDNIGARFPQPSQSESAPARSTIGVLVAALPPPNLCPQASDPHARSSPVWTKNKKLGRERKRGGGGTRGGPPCQERWEAGQTSSEFRLSITRMSSWPQTSFFKCAYWTRKLTSVRDCVPAQSGGFCGYELSIVNFGALVDGRRYYDGDGKSTVAPLARSFRVQPSTIRAVLGRRGAYARKYNSKPGDVK